MDTELIQKIFSRLDSMKPELSDLSLQIWNHPEIGYTEHFASSLLSGWLEKRGFAVQRGVGALDTAFIARRGEGLFHVGFCSEYDALPFGHGCGHNLFSVAAAGAAAALSEFFGGAEIRVLGTPSEEAGVTGSSGKVFMLRDGAFDGLDIAMIAHAGPQSVLERRLASVSRYDLVFIGKGAHSGEPQRGINALSAAECFLTGMNALRQQFEPGTRFNAVITECGTSANTVPERCALRADMRTETPSELEKLVVCMKNAAKGAAMMIGCQVEIHEPKTVDYPLRPNHALAASYGTAMKRLGIDYIPSDTQSFGWDMANVGYAVPVIAPYHKIGPDDLVFHTEKFKECARTPMAFDALLDAAKCMAWTALDYCTNEELRRAVAEEFAGYRLTEMH